MQVSEELRSPLPRQAILLGKPVSFCYRILDWIFHSRYNPFYRSGTLAVGFLLILFVTGLYLVFFYSVSDPYGSVERIQAQNLLGRWVRALHRYSTAGVIICTISHVVQLLVQGKSWGPRLLAWLSGVILTGIILVSAWTGYVMVWDEHGQRLVLAGAKMLSLVPILNTTLTRAFDGSTAVTPGFFFMNIFLHLAIPVGLIFTLWIHTARISRSRWLPKREVFLGALLAFLLLAFLRPAPLGEPANLLRIPGVVPTDLFVSFFTALSPLQTILLGLVVVGVMVSIPWWWRPGAVARRRPSQVDYDACSGCTQCARDCPYEAIRMLPRKDGKRLVAEVLPESCVSCGICLASCDDLAVGPPLRSGREQLAQMEELLAGRLAGLSPEDVVMFVCHHNGAALAEWEKVAESGLHVVPVDCCGTVHTMSMERLLGSCGGLMLHACPERNCFNRDGLDLVTQRIFYKRVPFLDREIDRARLAVAACAESEMSEAKEILAELRSRLAGSASGGRRGGYKLLRGTAAVLVSAAIVSVVGLLSGYPLGNPAPQPVVRYSLMLPALEISDCRQPTAEDLAGLPLHMQRQQICDEYEIEYLLQIYLSGKELASRRVSREGARWESLALLGEYPVEPGKYTLTARLSSSRSEKVEEIEEIVQLQPGRILLLTAARGSTELELR